MSFSRAGSKSPFPEDRGNLYADIFLIDNDEIISLTGYYSSFYYRFTRDAFVIIFVRRVPILELLLASSPTSASTNLEGNIFASSPIEASALEGEVLLFSLLLDDSSEHSFLLSCFWWVSLPTCSTLLKSSVPILMPPKDFLILFLCWMLVYYLFY